MAYHIYQTPGLILSGHGVGETNKTFRIFTKDLGVIDASAQAVREVKSKLRMHLRDFSLTSLSLVHGKGGWKLTSAREEKNFYSLFEDHPGKLAAAAHIFNLLRRLLSGEERNPDLYEITLSGLEFLISMDESAEDIKNLEYALTLSILHHLGYLGEKEEFKKFAASPVWGKELLLHMEKIRPLALREIQRSLEESGL